MNETLDMLHDRTVNLMLHASADSEVEELADILRILIREIQLCDNLDKLTKGLQ